MYILIRTNGSKFYYTNDWCFRNSNTKVPSYCNWYGAVCTTTYGGKEYVQIDENKDIYRITYKHKYDKGNFYRNGRQITYKNWIDKLKKYLNK